MELRYTQRAVRQLAAAPPAVRKAFYKQAELLRRHLGHPSIKAKKYDEANGVWQGRVNLSWRFYFLIEGKEYVILAVIPHPK